MTLNLRPKFIPVNLNHNQQLPLFFSQQKLVLRNNSTNATQQLRLLIRGQDQDCFQVYQDISWVCVLISRFELPAGFVFIFIVSFMLISDPLCEQRCFCFYFYLGEPEMLSFFILCILLSIFLSKTWCSNCPQCITVASLEAVCQTESRSLWSHKWLQYIQLFPQMHSNTR